MLLELQDKYKDVCVSIEDFILYQATASTQVNSSMETCQLLGIVKHWCWSNGMIYYIRPASHVKHRWSDDVMIRKHIISAKRSKSVLHMYASCRPNKILCDHERDAIRHAVHCTYFENGRE